MGTIIHDFLTQKRNIEQRVGAAERDINSRARDLIMLKTGRLEYLCSSIYSKSFCWDVQNFQERMWMLQARKAAGTTGGSLWSPPFELAMLPRMRIELRIDGISKKVRGNRF